MSLKHCRHASLTLSAFTVINRRELWGAIKREVPFNRKWKRLRDSGLRCDARSCESVWLTFHLVFSKNMTPWTVGKGVSAPQEYNKSLFLSYSAFNTEGWRAWRNICAGFHFFLPYWGFIFIFSSYSLFSIFHPMIN